MTIFPKNLGEFHVSLKVEYEFAFGQGEKGKHAAMEILRRSIKKGLVNKIPRPGYEDVYYLTEKGRLTASEIAKEVDEHKSW